MNIDVVKKKAKETLSEVGKKLVLFPDYISRWEGESKACYDGLYDEDEVLLLRNLDQMQNPHVLVVGSRNRLKDFRNKVLQNVTDGKSDNKDLNDYTVFVLDGQKFYISLTDDVADDMKKLAKKLERFGKVILYIENFDYFTKYNLLNTLIPLLYGDIRIIAPIETDAYEASIFENILISSFFCLFTLYEIERKDYKKYLVPSIYELETHHEIKYSPEAIDKVILLAMTFSHSSFFEEAYNELDFAASIAKEKGRTVVNAEDVMEVIEPQLKLLNGIDKDVKFRTAIHEAGHYTVYHAMEYLKSLNFEAITIIPSGLTLGLNQFTQNVYNVNHDIDYTRDVIAFNLGGWAAEKVFFEKPSIGSSQDIQNAVLTAYDSIAYGVLGEGNQNTSTVISLITQDSRMSTSEEKGALNKTMDNEFAMGKERALKVIKEHKDFTLKLAEELCKHPIMDAKELEKLVEKYY